VPSNPHWSCLKRYSLMQCIEKNIKVKNIGPMFKMLVAFNQYHSSLDGVKQNQRHKDRLRIDPAQT